ncbi:MULTISPECIES: hypothetical protein [Rhodococcus]|uniref:Uncharacterized protein n=1 Tax=Rhodococcus opacus RKJ300 = JCM 13270 TaxID=1165867 RepID=I0WTZ4_RHOOP|nr:MULTISPECIES: hypothetical protein [Rhodococcus]EID79860.1 hypothetical protein W59_11041 [Rhodococcus opacus RKJ300 = JCM 13270]KAF0959216.1 hypothetical protein MLGJGCBP_07650 [Rhodococcus sp. T7]QQZ18218.1 hypothetical protein GO592_38860 [Rhodococcus sp. 21391]UOT08143.1 hypothetical protein MPY17_37950 [Rhodococcus opacus]
MSTPDDILPPSDGVIDRVAPALRAALVRAETRLTERCATKTAAAERHAAAIKAVNLAHANLCGFLAADTAHPDGPTSQIDYYRYAYALIDRIAEARKAGIDVRLGEIEIRD